MWQINLQVGNRNDDDDDDDGTLDIPESSFTHVHPDPWPKCD
jgi:hypothetical protein